MFESPRSVLHVRAATGISQGCGLIAVDVAAFEVDQYRSPVDGSNESLRND